MRLRFSFGTSTGMLPLGTALAVAAGLGASLPDADLSQVGNDAQTNAVISSVGISTAVSFASDILPIFEQSCVNCHGGEYEGEQRMEASLDLRTYEKLIAGSEFGTVIEAGDPDGSILLEMVAVGDMPEEGDPLTPEQIELIRTWIAEGAENN